MTEAIMPRTRRRDRPLRAAALVAAALVAAAVTAVAIVGMAAPVPQDVRPQAAVVDVHSAFYAGCGRQAVAEPPTIPIWCSSSDQQLENLVWVSWGGARATATGVLTDNPCDCAGGRVAVYPVAVTFGHPTTVRGVQRYERLSVTFARDRPEWATRTTMHFLWGDQGFVSDQRRP